MSDVLLFLHNEGKIHPMLEVGHRPIDVNGLFLFPPAGHTGLINIHDMQIIGPRIFGRRNFCPPFDDVVMARIFLQAVQILPELRVVSALLLSGACKGS